MRPSASLSYSALLRLFALIALPALAGCAAAPAVPSGETPAPTVISPIEEGEVAGKGFPVDIYDPWEGWNRGVYNFNAEFDRLVFIPIVETYDFLTPEPVQDSVDNFFTNIDNILTFGNQILQGKPLQAAQTFFRFALNSTFGVLGLFDPATAIDVPQHEEDFGQTLGVWGFAEGPYMVLPLLGPSNLRDAAGFAVDTAAFAIVDPLGASSIQTEIPPIMAANIINTRAQIDFRYYQTGSPFEYDLLRFLYTKKRQLDIAR
ncbi:MAG: VacJ family lipoprotein [Kiloniellales bacterium]|nr:VacJ family lipoprotein [Kiloniellales bacterium]